MKTRLTLLLAVLLCAGSTWAQTAGPGISMTSASGGVLDYNPLHPIIWDDFLTGDAGSAAIGQLKWSLNGATSGYLANVANHTKVTQVNVAAGPATGALILPSNYWWKFSEIDTGVWWVSVDTGANLPGARIGYFSTSTTATPTDDAVYFEHLAADTNWFAVTRDATGAGGQTRTDTNVVYAANTWYKLQIAHPASGRWDFTMDGVLVASRTTGNIPAEATPIITAFQVITNGTAIAGYFDYYWQSFQVTR